MVLDLIEPIVHIYLTDKQKAHRPSNFNVLLLTSEIIMNQTTPLSQTPEFDANKSQATECSHIPSTGVLYQQPPSSEQLAKSNKLAKVKAFFKEVAAIALIGITATSTVFTVRSCSDDVDHQYAQALKHQLQFSASSEGAR